MSFFGDGEVRLSARSRLMRVLRQQGVNFRLGDIQVDYDPIKQCVNFRLRDRAGLTAPFISAPIISITDETIAELGPDAVAELVVRRFEELMATGNAPGAAALESPALEPERREPALVGGRAPIARLDEV